MPYEKPPSDGDIIALLWQRDEHGLRLADQKYRAYLLSVGRAVLSDASDIEECLNDTYLDAWKTIPPQQPRSLCAYLATIMRRRALDLFRKNHRLRRHGEQQTLPLEELGDILADPTQDREQTAARLGEAISRYLQELDTRARHIFISRYYLCRPVAEIARRERISRSTVQKQLAAIKRGLKEFLESEDISI